MSILRPTTTIDQVLTEFLAFQKERLSPRTYRNYESIIYYLRRSLNEYAYEGLNERDRNRFERAYEHDSQTFVKLFPPKGIVENLDHFRYFMDCKVIDSKAVMRAADTVIDRLIAWLDECGYIRPDEEEATLSLSEAPPPVPPETDLAFDEHVVPLPELNGTPQDRACASELRAGFVRWIGQVPARPVLLILRNLRDAHWWINRRDRLFIEIADRLGPNAHLLGDPSPPQARIVPTDERLIYHSVCPENALYDIDDEAAALYRERVRHGLVLRQSAGEDEGEPSYFRVVKYFPPGEEICRFAVIQATYEDRNMLDYPTKQNALDFYEWWAPFNAHLVFNETDIPTIQNVPFKPFRPCNGHDLLW